METDMTNRDAKLIQTDIETNAYPFSCLSSQIFVNGTLDLIQAATGTCGDWLCLDDHDGTPVWHCRLTACRFVWLRSAVKSAIASGKISEDFSDALASLDWIREIGITHGCFTADQVADHVRALDSFRWNDGLPEWAMDW